jgi:hypothetical protein
MGGRGYELNWPSTKYAKLSVVVLGEALEFLISEIAEGKLHVPTKQDRERKKLEPWWDPPRWDFTLTSRLKLTISAGEHLSVRTTWADGKRQHLEDCLGKVLIGLEAAAHALKVNREEKARREKEWAEQQKRAEEERRRQVEYDRKAETMEKLAQDWDKSKVIRAFALALRTVSEDPAIARSEKLELRSLANWGLQHADLVDPL